MLKASSILKYAIFGTTVIAFVGCRVANKPSYLTPSVYSSTSSDNQPPISLASTQDTEETKAARAIDPELIPYMPKEDEALDSLDEYSPQEDSFGSSASSGNRSQSSTNPSVCTSGCCSH